MNLVVISATPSQSAAYRHSDIKKRDDGHWNAKRRPLFAVQLLGTSESLKATIKHI